MQGCGDVMDAVPSNTLSVSTLRTVPGQKKQFISHPVAFLPQSLVAKFM